MDMMATMYVSVSRNGYDIFELSGFVKNTVQPYIERQNGVASVSPIGLVEQSVQVELDQVKIVSRFYIACSCIQSRVVHPLV